VYEPRYLSVARAPSLTGPYTKHGTPLLSPGSKDPYFNLGVGSLKTFAESWQGRTVASPMASIRTRGCDALGHPSFCSPTTASSGSACAPPHREPERPSRLKRAYAYAFDAKRNGNEIWLYFNARDGWGNASERIGLSRLSIGKSLDKMQACGSAQVVGTGGSGGSDSDAGGDSG